MHPYSWLTVHTLLRFGALFDLKETGKNYSLRLPHTNRVEAWSRVIQNQDGAYSTHVTLMTFPNWFRRARAPTNCLGPLHTSRQGPTRRFEI